MPKAVAEEKPLYYFVEDGSWHNFTLKSVTERKVDYIVKENHAAFRRGRKQVGETDSFTNWEWLFEGTDGVYKGDEITITTFPTLSTNRDEDVMRKMVEAFIGGPVVEGQEIDTDVYEGLTIQVSFKELPPRDGRDGRKFYNSTFLECAPADQPQGVATSTFADEPPF